MGLYSRTQVKGLVGQFNGAYLRVLKALGTSVSDTNVLSCPDLAELSARGGKLSNELAQRPILRLSADLGREFGGAPAGYRDMDECKSLKVLVRP